MTYLAYFSFTIVAVLILVITYKFLRSKKTTIPGLKPSDPRSGNLSDIKKAGNLHEFLCELHRQYGDIVSFWLGPQFTVSIASPQLFSQTSKIFNRPGSIFLTFEPFIGPDSIQFANGPGARKRRTIYDRCYSHIAVSSHYNILEKLAKEETKKLSSLPAGDHIQLQEYVFAFSLRAVTQISFGEFFKNEQQLLQFKKNYDICFTEMVSRLTDGIPEKGSSRQKIFEKGLEQLKEAIRSVIETRRTNPPQESEQLLIDVILEYSVSEEQIVDDCITFIVGGFHTTSYLIIWCLYHLAMHQEIQERAFKEIQETLEGQDVTPEAAKLLIYLRQILNETLRCTVVGSNPVRSEVTDIELGGHIIPKDTPIFQAIGVLFHDENYWPLPKKFDPDRFNEERKKSIPKFAFEPFGFAGKRKCPGYRLAYSEAIVFIATTLQQFKISLVPDQIVIPVYGFVTTPAEKIWFTLAKRV